jgi:EPS-associated MarR family transcriptional regulator
MRLIEAQPDISQRQLSRELGISLGGVNYCLNALIERGLVTMERFRASENKLAYAYALTPKGISAKAQLTRGFLARKMAEYEKLREEIESVREELADQAPEADATRS